MTVAIRGDIVKPDSILANGVLIVDDGRIIDILSDASIRADIDATGCLVTAGFVDMHVHGGGGAEFMAANENATRCVAQTHARFGTTCMLATTITASGQETEAAIVAATGVAGDRRPDEARILGMHLEGPYINPKKCGAQPVEPIRRPSVAEFLTWVEKSHNRVRQITLAPEMEGALQLIAVARAHGVVVSIGHTDSTCDEAAAAIAAGANQATHLFNAMRGLGHREPGTVGAVLGSPDIVAEIICDGVHVDPRVVSLTVKCKGVDRVVLITDAIAGAAMPDGIYPLGPNQVIVSNGSARFENGTLAGSVLTMSRAYMNIQSFASVGPVEASKMASLNPARQLGIDGRKGSLELGKDADIVVLNPRSGEVLATLVEGTIAYKH